MRIKLFRAATVALAMAEIRDTLGLDALILDTAKVDGVVEVTAALEIVEDESETFSPLPGVIAFGDEDLPVQPAVRHPPARPWSRHNLPAELDQALMHEPAQAACARLLRFSPLPLGTGAPPVMLVGPPGAGKTLTIAKLATRLVLDGQMPMVITADEQRAGAVEQLAGFTRLLGLTLIAAGRPETLSRALARRAPGAPVLIDAPGLDLLDPAHNALATELLAAAGACPVLVLPAGIDPVEAVETAQACASSHDVRHLLATRLDRQGRLGGILAAARAADLALTEAGISSAVANGLEPVSAEFLARRLSPVAVMPGEHQRLGTESARPRLHVLPSSNALAAHIAAQAGASRTAIWKHPHD